MKSRQTNIHFLNTLRLDYIYIETFLFARKHLCMHRSYQHQNNMLTIQQNHMRNHNLQVLDQ